jgi:DNA-directed RNA polymerase subunit K/omega
MIAQNFTKYERARILGARALQLAMNAPLLIKLSAEDLEKINYDVLKIAEVELDSGVLPISINKPFPERKEGKLKRDITPKVVSNEKKENTEESEEEKIEEEGEIMELANPEDEANEEVEEDASESYGE